MTLQDIQCPAQASICTSSTDYKLTLCSSSIVKDNCHDDMYADHQARSRFESNLCEDAYGAQDDQHRSVL